MEKSSDLRLVFLDAATFGDASLRGFTSRWDCAIHPFTAAEEVRERLRGYQVVIVNKVVLDRAVLESAEAKDLKLIAVAATGTDNVNLEGARLKGITVCNVPGYAAQSVAQFTIALILELATHAGRYIELVRQGGWEKSPVYTRLDHPILELQGKRLGIVGYGNIGRKVGAMARGLGLDVMIATRPGSSEPPPPERILLEDLLPCVDFLTLHCPLTPQTRKLIDAGALASMKATACLVNTARGGLIDEMALIDALRNRRLAGAALDVISVEPPPEDHPIIVAAKELDNLIVTPHCAWSAREARCRLLDEVAENVVAFTRGEKRNAIF